MQYFAADCKHTNDKDSCKFVREFQLVYCVFHAGLKMPNNFIKKRFTTKSIDRISETVSGQAPRPYNRTGTLLLKTDCKVDSSDAILPIL